jgi:6-phosphofructokinase 2
MREDMNSIVTLTLNPAIDLATTVNVVQAEHKLRCHDTVFDPGGGGVNVARVVRELGGSVVALWTRGGVTGTFLEALLDRAQLPHVPIPIARPVRESVTVLEADSGDQYRFVLEGPVLTAAEAEAIVRLVEEYRPVPEYLVLSGSLPGGLSADFYAQLAASAPEGTRVVVDTSGEALASLEGQQVFLIKPNLRELSLLVKRELETDAAIRDGALQLIDDGFAEVVLVSMGARGARLVSSEDDELIMAPPVRPSSRVGAGDSTVGGMVTALARGDDLVTAARYGVAAGTAAVMAPGTQLSSRADTERLFREMGAAAGARANAGLQEIALR